MLRKLESALPAQPEPSDGERSQGGTDVLFRAQKREDGTYTVSLTEDGVEKFETALGIAADFGRHTAISPYSTIADIMERTATREELSEVLRSDRDDLPHRLRRSVLKRKLRGSERPSGEQRTVSHIGRMVIVGLVGAWALKQFGVALKDVGDIPGILANLPSDILNLQPMQAFDQVGNNIHDAGWHVLLGTVGALFTYVAAKLVRPFARIYRKDQLVPGERPTVGCATSVLRRVSARWPARGSPEGAPAAGS
jgi:hypothetical protein